MHVTSDDDAGGRRTSNEHVARYSPLMETISRRSADTPRTFGDDCTNHDYIPDGSNDDDIPDGTNDDDIPDGK